MSRDLTPSPMAACTLQVDPGATHIRLIPAGAFSAPRGALAGAGPWQLTPAAAARVIAASRDRQADILIDYEHQTLLAQDNGKPAPAAGWIDPRSLEFRADGDAPGLYGAVRWVGDAAALIASEQYRYLSPVFSYDAGSGEPLDLLHVALTNFPAIDEPIRAAMSARAPRIHYKKESFVTLYERMRTALGLADGTSDDDALAAVAALKAKADAADGQIAALSARLAAAPPVEAVQAMQAELAALQAQIDADARARLIGEGMADGRLNPALAEWAGTQPLAALKSFMDAAPKIAALAGMQTGGTPPAGAAGSNGLSGEERAVCQQLGISFDQFAAYQQRKGAQ